MKITLAAAALAFSSVNAIKSIDEVTHPADGLTVDIPYSTKLIGRISIASYFDDWVEDEKPQPTNTDMNPCIFQWFCAFPWEERSQDALFVAHNCPKFLVNTLRFNTLLQNDNVAQFHSDDTVRRVSHPYPETQPNWLLVESFITQPKTEATKTMLANDDAFLFDDQGEPAWTYGYHVCLAWEDCSGPDFTRDADDQ